MLAFFLDRVLMTWSRNALKSDLTFSSVMVEVSAAPDEDAAAGGASGVLESAFIDLSFSVALGAESEDKEQFG